MTLRAYLARERLPEYCGINARSHLKAMVKPSGRAIHRKIALRDLDSKARKLCAMLEGIPAA